MFLTAGATVVFIGGEDPILSDLRYASIEEICEVFEVVAEVFLLPGSKGCTDV